MKNQNYSNLIRRYHESDLPEFLRIISNEAVFYPLLKDTREEIEIQKSLAGQLDNINWFNSTLRNYQSFKPTSIGKAIVYQGNLIGGIECGLINTENELKNGELAYWIGRSYWGKGIATQAVKEFTSDLFKNQKFDYIYAVVSQSNLASQRVLEKNGFVLEEIVDRKRKKYFLDNVFSDY